MINKRMLLESHPCFSLAAHGKFGRLHLPVAPLCNVQCRYCVKKFDCANESRPAITSRLLSKDEAVERVEVLIDRKTNLSVIGIAGPGDSIFNETTLEVCKEISSRFPELILCISTNGLLLADRIEDLKEAGISSITITINAATAHTAQKIYSWVNYKGRKLSGVEGAELLLQKQYDGLKAATNYGFAVKINTVLMPEVNDKEITTIALRAARYGAEIMNVMPLIPQGEFSHLRIPKHSEIVDIRAECAYYLPQMGHCVQCRSDACGLIGEDVDVELEMLMAGLGVDYDAVVC
ncbi:MAG: radical SAM protein [Nitrospirae bacterium]|nr:radical SAM protein [Nitrospirota bacterium]MBF0536580.1 radical SAM protein [Nitrospirota bacterium]MBF0618294.1 radical SAM protein [Nitrospirota bacterium]